MKVICHFRINIVKDNEYFVLVLQSSVSWIFLALMSTGKTIFYPKEEISFTPLA